MRIWRKIVPFISHMSLALMLSILTNGVLFFHSHELENGKIITHAHPVLFDITDEDASDHGHTEMELIILDLIAHGEYFAFHFEVAIPQAPELNESKASSFVSHDFFQTTSLGFDHRGPPIFS
ncbi:hypothetical protein A33Q_4245 [Indibacter alkaliphilus LW1]|jgi:hypothetical protein|uniref:Uncharacterized protein n=1 Tax=Indibacter alkaliphilus (strain CCUG 57479 / KCTC 22604 / LW1) TaxID=1189612 RepID=S2CYB5_INDAL|nr:hypothetical protein [Indibacter alkaliphilus]EOZ92152.1 hypothetical protein A33Q_4245 [Indibacter alkaliphilus LW1]